MKFSWLAVILSILSVFHGPELSSQPAIIKTYTVQDGLVMNRIRGFHQDASGFMWIYTWDGLSRFEGYRFRNYIAGKDLAHSLINDIIELPDESMYVALNDGTVELIRDSEIIKEKRIQDFIINSFYKDNKGNIFAGTDYKGIVLFNPGKLPRVLNEQAGNSILRLAGKENLLFIVTANVLLVARIYYGPSRDSIERVTILKEWPATTEFNHCILTDKKGNVLVGTSRGIRQIMYSGTDADDFQISDPSVFPSSAPWKDWQVYDMVQSEDGTYWFGTNHGLVRFRQPGEWTVMTKEDKLPSDFITSLFIDRSQTLWMGTENGVSNLLTGNSIAKFSPKNCANYSYLLPQPDGSMYGICSYDSIVRINASGDIVKSIYSKETLGLLAKDSTLYVIHPFSIEQLPGEVSPASDLSMSTKFAAENNGKIYWTSDNRIFCYPHKGGNNETGFNLRVETIAKYSDTLLLFGTWNSGLFVGSSIPDSCDIMVRKDLSGWLPSGEVRSLMTGKNGDIWVGSRYDGVTRLRCDPDFEHCETETYRMTDGLTSNWVTSIAEDHHGNIWVSSIAGIDKLVPFEDSYKVFSFSKVFGFYETAYHIVVSPENTIWIVLSSGYALIKDGMIDRLPPPKTFITEAVLGGNNALHWNTGAILPHDKNYVHFEFTAPDYINSTQLKFTYRLYGSHDTLWSKPETNHVINYGSLRPGSYTFEVAASGWDGQRGIPARYSFEIRPPFWKQFWFMALVIIMISLILFALYKFRIAQLQRLQIIRDRIASDLHDEIGSSLSHVNILSEIGRQEMQKGAQPVDVFERIGSEAQYSSEALDDIIWSVKTRADVIGDVVARMRQYATELFGSSGTGFRIKENISYDHALGMEYRRDLYLAYKELLRNIHRHASASHVDIEITVNRHVVRLRVDDDGKGFDVSSPTHRNGLANIKARAKRWQGNAVWDSKPGKGTSVVVEMRHS